MRMGTSISVEEIGTCIPIVDLGPPSIDGHVLNSALPIRYYLKIHLPNYPRDQASLQDLPDKD